ncbi:MAG: hypothetical protein ACRERC_13605, partial [Candidatus Binatia bacterium]
MASGVEACTTCACMVDSSPDAPPGRGQMVRWQGFPLALDRGSAAAPSFAPLGCRGFSYVYSAAPTFRLPFAQRVDLRFALHLPKTVLHPQPVLRALRRDRCRHVVSAQGRCAGFGLGATRREAAGLAWYIYVLQSDLALLGRPAVRDYLRGWRKVLMACVLNDATAQAVRTVYLAPAAAVFEAAQLNRGFALTRMPDLWRQIYDRTAEELGMAPCEVATAVNIQTTPHRRALPCRTFYRLNLAPPLQP